MSEELSDIAKIDYISTIDFSKGFQRFHMKWPLKDLTKPKFSSKFETTVIDGGRKIVLNWLLEFHDFSKDPTRTWFGAHLKTSGKITPMIYRICLSSSTNVLFDSSWFMVFDGNTGFGDNVLSTELNAYPIDDLTLHYWMDIPIGIVIGNNSDKLNKAKRIKLDLEDENSLQKASTDVFVLDASKVFSRVVGADPDPTSDISVIIVKKKEEEEEIQEEEKEERRFQCHTVFLSSRSDVFERMFASSSAEWKENCIKDGRSVKIKDINAQVMETALQYIYTSTLPDPSIDHDHLCGLIFASDKYNLPELKKWCVGVLIVNHNSIEDRIEQLILADRHKLAQLKSVCIDQLSLNFSILTLDRDTVKEISNDLWSEIMKAVKDREMKTTEISLQAA